MNFDNDPITVRTSYRFEQMREFLKYNYRHQRYVFFLLVILLLIYLVQLFLGYYGVTDGGSAALSGAQYDGDLTLMTPIVFIALVAFVGIQSFGLLHTRKKHKDMISKSKDGLLFFFKNNGYDIETTDPDGQETIWHGYETIRRIAETKTMFYLYTGRNQAFLIEKHGFTKGTPEELRILLKQIFPPSRCKFL